MAVPLLNKNAFLPTELLKKLGQNTTDLLNSQTERREQRKKRPDAFVDNLIADAIDLAEPNKFEVQIFKLSPGSADVMSISTGKAEADLHLYCESAVFPGRSIVTTDRQTYGPGIKIPYGMVYGDVTFTFRVDIDHSIKRYFDDWQQSIINPWTYKVSMYDSTNCPYRLIIVNQFDRAGKISNKIELRYAFPETVTEIPVDWNADNSYERLSVVFSYYKWVDRWVDTF